MTSSSGPTSRGRAEARQQWPRLHRDVFSPYKLQLHHPHDSRPNTESCSAGCADCAGVKWHCYLYYGQSESRVLGIRYSNQVIINLTVLINKTYAVSCDVFKCIEIYTRTPNCKCLIIKWLIRNRTFSPAFPSKLWRSCFSCPCSGQATHFICHSELINDFENNCVQPLGISIKMLAKHSLLLLTSLFRHKQTETHIKACAAPSLVLKLKVLIIVEMTINLNVSCLFLLKS